jgi:hypothetical protein
MKDRVSKYYIVIRKGKMKPKIFLWKYLICLVLIVFVAASIFGYDGTVWGGYDGNFTRYNFIQQASNIDLAMNVLYGRFGNNIRIETLYSMGEDDVDTEDVQMMNDNEAYILKNFRINNGDAYSYAVKRGQTSRGWDGWVIFSHYSSSQGWLHYIYYFEIRQGW